ncbi:MAG: hypothetical protein ACREVJ_17105, partial [Gammaproteobacteria bacterium]
MDLRYHDGALSGEIRNRELGRVLCDLARVTGARFILSGGSLPDRAVWVRLSNTALPIALRQILGGLSFVVYPRADGVAVKVLSNEKKPWKGRRARDEALRCDGSGDTAAAESLASTFAESNGLRAVEETPAPRTGDQVETDGVAEQESFYQRVGQAAEGLQSEDPKRRRDAVHEWLELKDRRASRALVELSLTPSGSSNRARLRV